MKSVVMVVLCNSNSLRMVDVLGACIPRKKELTGKFVFETST